MQILDDFEMTICGGIVHGSGCTSFIPQLGQKLDHFQITMFGSPVQCIRGAQLGVYFALKKTADDVKLAILRSYVDRIRHVRHLNSEEKFHNLHVSFSVRQVQKA
ncbi:unnamed protein product [Aphanomyces euteiches]